VRTLSGTKAFVYTLVFSPNSKSLAVGDSSGTILIWDVSSPRDPLRYHAHQSDVRGLAFSPDGKSLASASSGDNHIKYWDPSTGKPQGMPIRGDAPFFAVAFSRDGRSVAGGSLGVPGVWDFPGPGQKNLRGSQKDAVSVAFSADDKTLASATRDGSLKLWDLRGGVEQLSFAHDRSLSWVAYSPDGDTLAVAHHGGKVILYDTRRRAAGATLAVGPPFGIISQVVFSPEGRHIATANGNGTVYLLRLPEKR
jgi:WD40 repeat protein